MPTNKYFLLALITMASGATSTTVLGDQLAGSNHNDVAPANHAPTNHAPIGVVGDHLHNQGEWMISYRFGHMEMKDNLKGSDSISTEEIVLSGMGLRVVPLEMTTDMHMFGGMYAPSDKLSLMLMLSYIDKEMELETFADMSGSTSIGRFTTETSGFGDTTIAALYGVHAGQVHNVHLNFALSIPTGSIKETGKILTPMNIRVNKRLPYPMQLGSGTYDLEPGVTYTGHTQKWDWGSQAKLKFRIDDNDEGYSLGDQTILTGWGSYHFAAWISASLRLTYTHFDDINGSDEQINTLPVQTAKSENFGQERLDLNVGVNILDTAKGHRLAVEYTTTINQHVNGIQLEMQDALKVGYQYSF